MKSKNIMLAVVAVIAIAGVLFYSGKMPFSIVGSNQGTVDVIVPYSSGDIQIDYSCQAIGINSNSLFRVNIFNWEDQSEGAATYSHLYKAYETRGQGQFPSGTIILEDGIQITRSEDIDPFKIITFKSTDFILNRPDMQPKVKMSVSTSEASGGCQIDSVSVIPPPPEPSFCGNNACDMGEATTCPGDCGTQQSQMFTIVLMLIVTIVVVLLLIYFVLVRKR